MRLARSIDPSNVELAKFRAPWVLLKLTKLGMTHEAEKNCPLACLPTCLPAESLLSKVAAYCFSFGELKRNSTV